MRASLILSVCIVLVGAMVAQAEIVPVVSGAIPAGSLSYTRTHYDSTMDEIDIHIAGWITGTEELQLLEGTWTALNELYQPAGFINATGTSFDWKSRTANNGFAGQVAPQSYINFNSTTSNAAWARTGSGLVNPTLTGSWYTDQSSGPDARLMPLTPNLPDFDNSLLAKMYVSKDAGIGFLGNASWGGWGFSHSVTKAGGFQIPGTPEPSTLLLAASGLVGLLCYAWRKRR
jgi:hypothetical protein